MGMYWITFLKINLYLFIYILGVVNARSDGAPSAPSVCVNLEPGHGSEPMPNDGVGPFKSVPTTCSVDKGLLKYIDESYQSYIKSILCGGKLLVQISF